MEQNYFLSILISIVLFFAISALALPGGIILTLSYGFLFDPLIACLIAVFSGTIGGYIPFWLAKKSFLKQGSITKFKKLIEIARNEINSNPWSYLLAMRFNPIFPFIAQSIIPGVLQVSSSIFILTSILGLILPSMSLGLIGNGLNTLFLLKDKVSLGLVISNDITIGLLLFSLLFLILPLMRFIKRKKNE